MRTIKGVYTSADIFTDDIEEYAIAQIQMLCDNMAFQDSRICIMPDVHPGKVGTIGFTAVVGSGRMLPNVVGCDIGCGMTLAKLKQNRLECQKLDRVIRENIPSGSFLRKIPHRFSKEFDFSRLYCMRQINKDKAERSIATLGGGNHFIECDKDESGVLYVLIHSGSRHLGKEVTDFYLREGQKHLREAGLTVPYELTYVEGELQEHYIHDVSVVQEYAALNRDAILDELVKGMKWKTADISSCVHNYIDCSGKLPVIRKGAVSAKKGEPVIIPVNMRAGVILGTGLGKEEWNESAPHGAGRVLSREKVKEQYTVSDYKKSMKGIYSTAVNKETLDEAPFAYRGMEKIRNAISETVEVTRILTPVYNFKAGDKKKG